MASIKITDIYDNTKVKDGLISGWGLSVLLSGPEYRVLFDTGADCQLLSHNMEKLGVSSDSLDGVFLSHPHCDHIGGLSAILDENENLKVYLTEKFPRSLKNKITDYGAELVVLSDPGEIIEGVYTTGELSSSYRGFELPEQGLVLDSSRGPLVVSGCAHPGIIRIVERARELMNRPPYIVIGGFHLGGKRERKIQEIINQFVEGSIDKLAPTHCTGEQAIKMIKREFQDDFYEFGVGRELLI